MIAPTGPMSRPSDPDTSHAAPPSPGYLSTLQRIVLDLFEANTCTHGHGLTDDEVVARLPGFHGTTVRKRRSELSGAGLLVDSGYRRPTPTGRMAIVWRCAS